jgi:hypothetical protein
MKSRSTLCLTQASELVTDSNALEVVRFATHLQQWNTWQRMKHFPQRLKAALSFTHVDMKYVHTN